MAFTWDRLTPRATVERLAEHGIFAWSGNYYALRLMERLALEAEGGDAQNVREQFVWDKSFKV